MRTTQRSWSGSIAALVGGAAIALGMALPAPASAITGVEGYRQLTGESFILFMNDREFYRPANFAPWNTMNWGTDGCSIPGWVPDSSAQMWAQDFNGACVQHDFCYRNARKFVVTSPNWLTNQTQYVAQKTYCDDRLLTETRRACDWYYGTYTSRWWWIDPGVLYNSCKSTTNTYRWAVGQFGSF